MVDSRYSPTFVGDVRCAITGCGSSWKLSGGSAWSSALTNVAKNRHVRRPIRRSVRASADESGAGPAVVVGMLIHRATAGDAIQSSSTGSATGHDAAFDHATTAAAAPARTTPPAIRR